MNVSCHFVQNLNLWAIQLKQESVAQLQWFIDTNANTEQEIKGWAERKEEGKPEKTGEEQEIRRATTRLTG